MSIRPFSCGTQYADWENYNCCHCRKYPEEEQWQSVEGRAKMCPIALAMGGGYFTGEISDEIARRASYPGPGPYNWRCGEFEEDGTQTKSPDNSFAAVKGQIVMAFIQEAAKDEAS